ncbi:response regulator [Nitrospira sp. KM1]|uniref:response regulator n=1 Tax=Nitrospira sp. KM1 TaxID=1936990 RepID=UPI001564C2E4|nr:response regulator [Nitrospira sp. KM1]
MIIDDDEDTLQLLTELIAREGCEISTALDAESALWEIGVARPHLLLIDIHLPDMNGVALLQELRAAGIQEPVVLLTAGGSTSLALEGMQAGAFDLLNKPFLISDLRLVVRRALSLPREPPPPMSSPSDPFISGAA